MYLLIIVVVITLLTTVLLFKWAIRLMNEDGPIEQRMKEEMNENSSE